MTISYTILNQLISLFLAFFRTFILTRFLEPSEFSSFAVDLSIYLTIEALCSGGFVQYILQKEVLCRGLISSALKKMYGISLLGLVIIYLKASSSQSLNVFMLMIFLLMPISIVGRGLIIKLALQRVEMRGIILSQVLLLLLMPFTNTQPLIVQYCLVFVPMTLPPLVVFLMAWQSNLIKSRSDQVEKGFDMNLALFGFSASLSKNVDKWLVLWFFDSSVLGLYAKMNEIANLLISKIRGPLEPVVTRLYFKDKVTLLAYAHVIGIVVVLFYFFISIFFDVLVSYIGDEWDINWLVFRPILMFTSLTAIFSVRGVLFVTNKFNKTYKNWGMINLVVTSLIFCLGFYLNLLELLSVLALYSFIVGPITVYFASKDVDQYFMVIKAITPYVMALIFMFYAEDFTVLGLLTLLITIKNRKIIFNLFRL